MHVCLDVFARALFLLLHACIVVYTCPVQVEHVSVTLCMWDQMWAGLIAFPAVPEQVLREPALSPRVDKQAIFKEREEENDSGLSKPDKFPTNTPSLAAPTVQRAGGRSEMEGEMVEASSEYIQRIIYFNMVASEFWFLRYLTCTICFPPVVILKSLLVDVLFHFCPKRPGAHLWIY